MTHIFTKAKKQWIFLSMITCAVSAYMITTHYAQGIDFTFTQTNWNGGQTSNIATHANNQSNWTQYSAKDANLTLANSGADLQLTNTTNTTDIDYNTESDYTQQDNTKTQFVNGAVTLEGGSLAGSTAGQNSVQAIGVKSNLSWKTFSVGANLYGFATNYYDGTSWVQNSYLYKWMPASNCFGNGSSCATTTAGQNALQTIGTIGGFDWEVFTIGADTYALLANQKLNDSSFVINSYLYKWMPASNCFGNGSSCATATAGQNALQTIETVSATDWHVFTADNDVYAVVANYYSGTSSNTSSYLYKWMSGSSCFGNGTSCANAILGANSLQAIGTNAARKWQSFTSGSDTYVIVSSYNNDATYYVSSYLYKWMPGSNCLGNGTNCATAVAGQNALQMIGTVGALDWQTFTVGSDIYALVAQYYSGSVFTMSSYLYKWMPGNNCFGNGTSCANSTLGANVYQSIGTTGAVDWQTFTVGSDTYALVANLFYNESYITNSYLYKWMSTSNCFGNGTSCANSALGTNAYQSIMTMGAYDWETFSVDAGTYAIMSSFINGTSYLTTSYLYKWTGTGFGTDNVTTTPQTITTNIAQKSTSNWGSITNITTTQNTPTNTSIKYLVSFDNRTTWKYWNGSTWQTTNLSNIATNGMTKQTIESITQQQWSQTFTPGTVDIAASLATTNANFNPSLDNIQITYTQQQTQTLTSNIYNTELPQANIAKIQWTENLPQNTDIRFQLRTSPDGNTWTNWCGPDNNTPSTCATTTYFTDPQGSEIIDDTQRDRINDQYIQYKAFLTSTDGISTPTLSDISLSYTTIIVPTITTNQATSITPTQATLNANLTNTGGENPTRYIQWGTTSGVYTDSCNAGTGGTGTYTCNLSNLNPNTTYYVRAYATNSAGTSYGNELSFTTNIAQPTTTTQAASNITTTQATANATITTTGGENPTREIEYGTQENTYTQTCSANTGGAGTYSCTLTNLTPNTTYYYRAKATNTAGTTYGTQTSFTTNVAQPTATTQAATNITAISATLNATVTSTGGQDPTRRILYGTDEQNLTQTCTQGTGTGTYSCTLTNLTPNTTYYVQAQVQNDGGESTGNTVSFTTQELPQVVTITNPDNTKIENATTSQIFSVQQGTLTNTQEVKTNTQVKLTTTNTEVTLPTNTVITETNDNSFDFTQFQTTNTSQAVRTQIKESLAAIKVGVPNTRMTFSQPITITLNIDSAYNGKTMNILYQEDNDTTWHTHGTCTITNGNCTFTTTHATTYTVNGDGTISGAGQNDITTDVQDVLSLDCDQTGNTNDNIVEFNELTPGTPVTASTTCTVTTNSDAGYTLSVKRNDTDATMDKDSDSTTKITDKTPWNSLLPNATTWQTNDTHLAFTVYSSTATKNTTWWGTGTTQTDANNKYAGFPTTFTDIMQHTTYNETATTTNIGYKLDVPTTQKSGTYAGDITYQVVTAP